MKQKRQSRKKRSTSIKKRESEYIEFLLESAFEDDIYDWWIKEYQGFISDDPMPHSLSTFQGYTVDFRLREFRKVDVQSGLEFIPFDSPEGRKLINEMRDSFGKG